MQSQPTNEAPSGIVLLAKQTGATSFSSLSSIKKALGTSKVGHTGTLDSFADGLLVVLTGRLTRLVPHITGFDKTYLALIEFGTETDTLDPTGEIIRTGEIPTRAQVEKVLAQFRGKIDQVPPVYSAIHVGGGKRASELAREGKTAQIPARKITIYDLKLLDFQDKYALVEVSCSKGTYIRALARDIAAACGSCAHLAALRRTRVGPFELKDAAGADDLGDFTIDALAGKKSAVAEENAAVVAENTVAASESAQVEPECAVVEPVETTPCASFRPASEFFPKIRASLQEMTPALAEFCGFVPVELNEVGSHIYANGRPLKNSCFYYPAEKNIAENAQFAVFYPDGHFAGVVEKKGRHLSYGFVIPRKTDFTVYSWEQIAGGKLNSAWKEQGTALTIGSFDGPHFGHEAVFQAILAQENLIPGVITFSRSLRGFKNPSAYEGDVATLSQKLSFFEQKGFAFAVVIDFSADFAKIKGTEFLSVLQNCCNMKFLVEGKDFCCGYQGAMDVTQIIEFSRQKYFDFMAVAPILYQEKKVSSSRIRKAILAADFQSAIDMLHYPFTVDCAGFAWKRDGQYLVAQKTGIQVLPKDGDYQVLVQLSGRGEKTTPAQTSVCVHTVLTACKLVSGSIRLLDSDGSLRGIVRAVQFGNSGEKYIFKE